MVRIADVQAEASGQVTRGFLVVILERAPADGEEGSLHIHVIDHERLA
jgi:hypothetical protein